MKKIINWTFGSFFRTFGRFIFYILMGILISYLLKDFKMPKIDIWQILDVSADSFQVYTGSPNETDEYLANINSNYFSSLGLNSYNKVNVYNCSSSSSCTGSVSYNLSNGGIVWRGTMANYGFDFVHDTLQVITTNHLYSYSYNFCVPSGLTSFDNNIYVNTGMGSGRDSSISLLRFDYYSSDNIEWLHYDQSGANVADTFNCYTMYNLFNYTGSNSNTIKVNLKTSSFNNQYIGVLGYKLEDLGATNGLTSSQVQNIIDNSGLASASSINQVQSSINNVQNQLTDVNDSIQDQIQADEQNTQDIIDNQNANNQAQIESQQICSRIDKINIKENNKILINNGRTLDTNGYGITDYIIVKNTKIKVLEKYTATNEVYSCFYNVNKTLIECIQNRTLTQNDTIEIPINAEYARFTILETANKPQLEICKNGNQALNDTLTNDHIDENETSNFANGLDREYSSLTPFSDFINLPLTWIQSLFSSQNSCQPINLPLPYLNNKTLTLPCMTEFWQRMGALGTLIQMVWIAIVGVRIFNGLFLLTCETLDPNPDKDMTKLRTWEL